MKPYKMALKKLEYKLKLIRTFFISDLRYRKRKHLQEFRRVPDFENPQSLNEKINNRMIFERDPFFTMLADKVAVREYVKTKIGEDYLVPLLGCYERAELIDLSELPEQFVLKCSHDSGSAIICKNKHQFDERAAKKKLNAHLNKNMYYVTREWHYKNIKPYIICEKFIDVFGGEPLHLIPEVYRVHCFSGKAHITEADFTDAMNNEYVNVYDPHWKLLPLTMGYNNTPHKITEPIFYRHMITLAEKLAEGIAYCRVDFIANKHQVFFSEITLTPCNGRIQISPVHWDYFLGELWV
ncbi:ATP-grasp fold amidoligase family protein [Rahnella aquatilis]|uniref:ATP-grasp fold amidoligase family protein n=1 Tax=Rahnella aquatilis TaxID=34038 RepID=UPI003654CD56